MPSKDKGQVLISLLFISSLLIGLLLFSAGFIKWVQVKNHSESICRKHYLKAQSYVIKYASKLKKLNPRATSLRLKLIMLTAKVLILKDPIAIASTLYQIKKVKAKQRLLDAKQKAIISMAKYKLKLQSKSLTNQLRKILNLNVKKVDTVPFKMTAKPAHSTAPTYHLPFNFKNEQTVQAHWNWTDLNFFKTLFNFTCSVGVKKKGVLWTPSLKRANPSLNLF